MTTSLDHFFLAPSAAISLPASLPLVGGNTPLRVSLCDAPLLARLALLQPIGW